MYVSDYGFAASSEYWTASLDEYDIAVNSNWMYLGSNEWTISRRIYTLDEAFEISNLGFVYYNETNGVIGVYRDIAARPCFYLTLDTQYSSGSGTSSDPIRIVV